MGMGSQIETVECSLSQNAKAFTDETVIKYPSHRWSVRLKNGGVYHHSEMSLVYDWVIENTVAEDHEKTLAMFQKVNEELAKQPGSENR